jgi:aspartokinase-like uncharacterized kinase
VFLANFDTTITYVIIAGGGWKCNQLREKYAIDTQYLGKEDAYHWEAVKIMGENARMLKEKIDRYSISPPERVITDLSLRKMRKPGIFLVDPLNDLHSKDPLEHSWRVTSDSISMYYAYILHAPICVLVKNKPYFEVDNTQIHKITCSKLLELHEKKNISDQLGKGVVDSLTPVLSMQYQIPVFLLDGADKKKISGFFRISPTQLLHSDLTHYGIEIVPN